MKINPLSSNYSRIYQNQIVNSFKTEEQLKI
jgi:hypothetical protein